MEDSERMLKGQSFVNLVKYVKKKRGEQGVDAIFKRLRKDHPNIYVPPNEFKSKDAYPLVLFARILEIMDQEIGRGDLKEIYDFGLWDAKNLGIQGFFVSFLGTPELIIKEAPKSWDKYHNGGKLEVKELGNGRGIMEVSDTLVSEAFCQEMYGFFQGAGQSTRAKNVKVEKTKCTSKGDGVCEYVVTWDV